jgi:hypothetical protein
MPQKYKDGDYFVLEGYTEKDLKSLGFKDTQSFGYGDTFISNNKGGWMSDPHEDDEKNIAYTFGHAKFGDKDVFAIVVRGTPDGAEWNGDFKLKPTNNGKTNKGNEENLSFCADTIIKHFTEFVSKTNSSSAPKLWICGHSRGGGVSELLGKKFDNNAWGETLDANKGSEVPMSYIDSQGTHVYFNQQNIFDYAIAPMASYYINDPLTGKPRNDYDLPTKYDNVFSIQNPADIAPTSPLAAWGYRHIGKTKTLNLPELHVAEDMEKSHSFGDYAQRFSNTRTAIATLQNGVNSPLIAKDAAFMATDEGGFTDLKFVNAVTGTNTFQKAFEALAPSYQAYTAKYTINDLEVSANDFQEYNAEMIYGNLTGDYHTKFRSIFDSGVLEYGQANDWKNIKIAGDEAKTKEFMNKVYAMGDAMRFVNFNQHSNIMYYSWMKGNEANPFVQPLN